MQKNPFLDGYGQWLYHLLPYGIQRLAFGDATGGDVDTFELDVARGISTNAELLSLITGDGGWQFLSDHGITFINDELNAYNACKPLMREPWLIMLSLNQRPKPNKRADFLHQTTATFSEAGWGFARSIPPYFWEERNKASGIIFHARPRGGYSHSYRSDGTIAWQAFGEMLSSGGGTMLKMNPHTTKSIAHNVALINGIGQEYAQRAPQSPKWLARIMAHRETKRGPHWVTDMTAAYPPRAGLQQWHRHILFLDQLDVVLIDDFIAEKPAHFSWLWHVDQADTWDWQAQQSVLPTQKMRLQQKLFTSLMPRIYQC